MKNPGSDIKVRKHPMYSIVSNRPVHQLEGTDAIGLSGAGSVRGALATSNPDFGDRA